MGAHLHVAAMVLPGFHTPNDIQLDSTANTRYSATSPTTHIVGDNEELSEKTNIPRQQRQPTQATKQEQEEHIFTHLPCRSWCPICVKANEQPTHHRKGALKEQSILQLDYAYIISNNPTDKKVHTILTGVETTT
eukprot:1504072-Amphidinium_carterae.1